MRDRVLHRKSGPACGGMKAMRECIKEVCVRGRTGSVIMQQRNESKMGCREIAIAAASQAQSSLALVVGWTTGTPAAAAEAAHTPLGAASPLQPGSLSSADGPDRMLSHVAVAAAAAAASAAAGGVCTGTRRML